MTNEARAEGKRACTMPCKEEERMSEMEKMKAGLEYSYADAELEVRKTQAILWCEEYNAIDGRDFEAQYAYLKKMLDSVGERVWIAKTFCCDCGKNIFIGNDFTGN